jgi:cytochrome c5
VKGRALLVGAIVLIAAAIVYNVQRERTHVYEDDAEHFKYGSIGSEPGVSLFSPLGGRLPPEWIFRVLPQVCTSMPSYAELGLIYEKEADGVTDKPLPVGVSRRRRLGADMIGVNCAFCHAGTVRVTPDSRPQVVPGMPPQQIDVQRLFHHLFQCIRSPEFTADNVMAKIRDQKGPSGYLDALMYRLLIPSVRARVAELEERIGILTSDRIPASGPGRLDTITPAKAVEVGWNLEERLARHGLVELVATMDFSPTWMLAPREKKRLHWDGNIGDVHESILSAVLAVGGKPQTVDRRAIQRVEDYIKVLKPPTYPYPTDPQLKREGENLFKMKCVSCHGGNQVSQVTPIAKLRTDPYRLESFSLEFAARLPTAMNRNYARSEYHFTTFRKTEGYVNVPLDGIWARAPYLHNGSVPSLRDLLQPEGCRPRWFSRGSDVYDPDNVGFESWAEAVASCPPRPGARRDAPPGTARNGARLFRYDTSLPGNGNTGHAGDEFGTDLKPAEKTALLEYLKSL